MSVWRRGCSGEVQRRADLMPSERRGAIVERWPVTTTRRLPRFGFGSRGATRELLVSDTSLEAT